MKAVVIQMNSTPNVSDNIEFVEATLRQANVADSLVVLPECFAYFGGKEADNLALAESLDEGEVQAKLAQLAKGFSCYLVAGSFPIKTASDNRYKPMCLVYGPDGHRLCHYQKIHLFDVDVADGTRQYRESDGAEPGSEVVAFDTPWGRVGVAICYDLRFPGLFQQLRDLGAEAIVLPSAFTQKTGEAHWHLLMRARAIENQCFMVGCNQVGTHVNGRETFGHSLIVDPWGEVLADADRQIGAVLAKLDKEKLLAIRQQMPVANHNRFHSRFVPIIE